MEKNMGMADAFVRFQVGVALLVNIIVLEPGMVGMVILLVIALLLLKSVFSQYCPLYKYLGISTIPATGKQESDEAEPQAAH